MTIYKQLLALGGALAILIGCEAKQQPILEELGGELVETDKRDTIFGKGGISILGGGGGDSASQSAGAAGAGVGVNAFLWRATLDTMSVWPISSADPFGGVIITDWYAPPGTPSERFKLNIFILDRALRADGVRVSVFRQVLAQNGQWLDARVQVETATRLENAILTRARQFRNETAQQ